MKVSNPSKTPALQIRLTLGHAKSGLRVLPVYYGDNYFSLLSGESRTIRIETRDAVADPQVTTGGWNIESTSLN